MPRIVRRNIRGCFDPGQTRRRGKILLPRHARSLPVSAAHPSTLSTTRRPVSIKQEDLIQSIADGLQYISYYHPVDYIRNLAAAYEREASPAAKDAIAQILINSRMCAEGHRPICQDTGRRGSRGGLDWLTAGFNLACGGETPQF